MEAGNNRATRRNVVVPTVWADFYRDTHIPAAVRVGDTLRLTGHTGETADGVFSDDPESQIRFSSAFRGSISSRGDPFGR
jgi:hypothetical protein